MKRKSILALLVVVILALSICFFVACDNDVKDPDTGITDGDGNNNGNNGGNDGVIDDGSDYSLPIESGCKQIIFYWDILTNEIPTSDMWVWWDGKEGSGYLMYPCNYGAKAVINVPNTITQVGFIARRDCTEPGASKWGTATKDYDGNRFAILTGETTVIYLKSGDKNQYKSSDGGKTLEQIKLFNVANMKDLHTIRYSITPAVDIKSVDTFTLYEDGNEIAISSFTHNKSKTSGKIIVEKDLDVSKAYSLKIEGYGTKAVVPIGLFSSEDFNEEYNYDGELGSEVVNDGVNFRLWAPTASKVVLNLFDNGSTGDAKQTIEMERKESGVWFKHVASTVAGHGTYYTYSVTTSVGTQEAVDPYAKSAGVNGNRGMVVDLSRTNPDGWDDVTYLQNINSYSEAVVWEIHVRDFSNKITSSKYPGKYLAFTETGLVNEHGVSVGIDYLKNLGITHVQLMPVYDYATVDEANPDSGFNWGYDPKNYNVPEGSYSTDPTNGETRIIEFKKMVQALHNAGIGVIMDVVYNHSYDANSSLNKCVPYYYYRYNADGSNTSASGCGNDTASERYMYRRFMIDSVKYWMTEFKLDGFRFDLMGLHDLETMRLIEEELHAINPYAMIYGEGWTMGSTIDDSKQANQTNISQIKATNNAIGAVGVFNDTTRDGLKGSVFSSAGMGYINGAGQESVSGIKFGYKGGNMLGSSWSVNNANVVNYMSCHDNLSLWDKLEASQPDADKSTLLAMNKLGASILMTMQGTVLMQAGEEMLRTKGGDENSYKSSDAVNNIDWSVLKEGSDEYMMMNFYKGLIALRKGSSVLKGSNNTVTFAERSGGVLAVTINSSVLVVLNPTGSATTQAISGNWTLVSDGINVSASGLGEKSGTVEVPAYTAYILTK